MARSERGNRTRNFQAAAWLHFRPGGETGTIVRLEVTCHWPFLFTSASVKKPLSVGSSFPLEVWAPVVSHTPSTTATSGFKNRTESTVELKWLPL